MAEKGFNNYLMPNGDYMLPLESPACPLCNKQHGANQKNLLNICGNGTCNVRPGDVHSNLALAYQDDQIPVKNTSLRKMWLRRLASINSSARITIRTQM